MTSSGRGTVFFGPFIGEFGWELLFWQGWVRKVCKADFAGFRKIACSVPGRQPFYPYVDEFWPLPEEFLKLGVSAHGYFTDAWRAGYPGKHIERHTLRSLLEGIRRLRWPRRVWTEERLDLPDVEPHAEAMLASFRERLPDGTIFYVPWKWNRHEPDGLEFGMSFHPTDPPRKDAFRSQNIGFANQFTERLEPTLEGKRWVAENLRSSSRLIALFPRCRLIKRPDRNWSRENYLALTEHLRRNHPEFSVAIFGEPAGVYFSDGVPDGCFDLIQVPPFSRMDIQLAALKQSVLAVGSTSGGIIFASYSGCPTIVWGDPMWIARYREENVLKTPQLYYPKMQPTVDEIVSVIRHYLAEGSFPACA